MKALILAASAALAVTTCTTKQPLPPEPAPVVVYPRDGGTVCCEAACSKMRLYGCPEGQPSATGEECVDLCHRIYAMNIDMGACCIAASKTKAEMLMCGTVQTPHAVRCQQ